MAQCLHGDGFKLVLRDPGLPVDDGQTVDAKIFTGIPAQEPQLVRLIVRDGALRIDPGVDSPEVLKRTEGVRFTNYQRLADEEEDTRTTALLALAKAFVDLAPGGPPEVDPLPALYTYFGQFIAHEVSRLYQPAKGVFENLGTSRFDLDTVFHPAGRFPQVVPDFAEGCQTFGVAALGNTAPVTTVNLEDLPRAVDGLPLVPDCRNDANPALAQLHVAILHKYRALLSAHVETEALRRLRTLLHAITIHDYLKEIVDDCVYEDVLRTGRKLVNPGEKYPRLYMTPIEFAAGAFRFGHAMVRSSYRWSRAPVNGAVGLLRLLGHTKVGGGLAFDGFPSNRRLRSEWTMAREDMLRFAGAAEPNLANRIAPALASGLQALDGHFVPNSVSDEVNLAEKTLVRGQEVRLASAQSLWARIEVPCGEFLSRDDITGPPGSRFHAALTMSDGGELPLADRTPLWFYVLREAEVLHCGRKLGPLGGRIVMETIHAAIAAAGSEPETLPSATLADLFDLVTT